MNSPVVENNNNINTKYLIIATIIAVGAAGFHVLNSLIITGLMAKDYEKKVISQNDDPPKLYNYLLHFVIGTLIVIVATTVFSIFGMWAMSGIIGQDTIAEFRGSGIPLILGFIALILPILAMYPLMRVMTRKKYFLYKEDGFRTINGIRMFAMSYNSIVTAIVVYAYIIYKVVKK